MLLVHYYECERVKGVLSFAHYGLDNSPLTRLARAWGAHGFVIVVLLVSFRFVECIDTCVV